mgnify:CR=1 FL=1
MPLTILTPADDDGQQRPSFNGKLCKALGARVVPCLKTAVAEAVDQTLAQIRAAGEKPYYIYGDRLGRGNEATPTRAYVPVWGEIMTQCADRGFTPDLISLAVGTGMTQAGLLCGRELAGGGPEVLGVSIARDKAGVQAHVAAYANAWFADKGLTDSITPENVRVCDAYRQSYGVYDETVAESLHGKRRYGLSAGAGIDSGRQGGQSDPGQPSGADFDLSGLRAVLGKHLQPGDAAVWRATVVFELAGVGGAAFRPVSPAKHDMAFPAADSEPNPCVVAAAQMAGLRAVPHASGAADSAAAADGHAADLYAAEFLKKSFQTIAI